MEIKELVEKLNETKTALEAKAKSDATQAAKEEVALQMKAIDEKIAAINQLPTDLKAEDLKKSIEDVKTLTTDFDALQLKMKQGSGVEKKSFAEKVQDTLKEKAQDLLNLKSKKGGEGISFDVKAAGTMSLGNYSGGTVGLTTWDPSFAPVPRRTPFLRQLVTVRPLSSSYVAWAEQANRDGGAGNTAEGAAKTQADFDIVEANKKVEKITAYTKVSKEALSDIAFLNSEINNDLVSLINLKLDADLFGGSGTSPVIRGINTYASTFSVASTGLANGIDNANEFDVLRAAMWQVENAYFTPNYILLNPIDVAKIDMLKATDNQYLAAPFGSQYMFKMFYGVPVIANNAVTAGNFLVGDFSKSNLGIREDINIQIGYENDDFTKNLVTILAEMRAVHYIKSNHTAAFVKGVFSTAKAALETA